MWLYMYMADLVSIVVEREPPGGDVDVLVHQVLEEPRGLPVGHVAPDKVGGIGVVQLAI